jgi:hypothetical protein
MAGLPATIANHFLLLKARDGDSVIVFLLLVLLVPVPILVELLIKSLLRQNISGGSNRLGVLVIP